MVARNALNHDAILLDSDGLKFEHGTLEEGVDCEFVPSSVNDLDTEEIHLIVGLDMAVLLTVIQG